MTVQDQADAAQRLTAALLRTIRDSRYDSVVITAALGMLVGTFAKLSDDRRGYINTVVECAEKI